MIDFQIDFFIFMPGGLFSLFLEYTFRPWNGFA